MKPKTFIAAVFVMLTAMAVLVSGKTIGTYPASQAANKTLAERLGYARDARLVIVHADDLGMTHSVNAASMKAFEIGLVNSGSVMIPCPWLPEIAAYARAHPQADIGLHLTLTSEWTAYRWRPVLPLDRVGSLLDKSGYFYSLETDAASQANVREAEAEIRAQIERAGAFGIKPTHLDSHMGTLYQNKALFEVLLRVARENKLPVRISQEWLTRIEFLPALLTSNDILLDRMVTIEPDVAAADWSKFYAEVLKKLQPGVTELVIHLAYDDEEMRAATFDHPDWGAAWRQREFDFFTSDAFRKLLEENKIKLITWRELGKLL
jgi:predicted glycoside hydrolase/deacetylase ChbG (UPF0249 family)